MDATPFGHYQLLELLGRGGMGQVFRAHDTVTDRIVALKVLPSHLAGDPVFQQRFRREAHAAAGLSDPHVVPIHGYGEIDGQLYLDMRLIDGKDLGTVLSEADGPLPPERAVTIVEQVAAALDAAHAVGPGAPRREAVEHLRRGSRTSCTSSTSASPEPPARPD